MTSDIPGSGRPSPQKQVVVLDDGALSTDALKRLSAYASELELIGSSPDSPTRAALDELGIPHRDVEAEATVGGAIEYASANGIDTVVTGRPEKPQEWMRSALTGVAAVATAGGEAPAIHVLSSSNVASGPVVVASTTGEIAGPEARIAVEYAARLGHDVEIVTPTKADDDVDTDAAVERAATYGVKLERRAVEDPATDMVVRAASISAVVLGVLDLAGRGKLDAGEDVSKKALSDGQAREVIDAITASPPHDVLVFFNGVRLVGGEETGGDTGSHLTDGAQPAL
ncbi:hypothetical protein WDJ51_02680 [Rathayibacter sp. YIM 133350]|uniref:hypothetical protein n=1 Tax=Rathayibacter sp. YIM 133350 TaxID=3131992 RepID=UPI00307EEFE0